MNNKNNINKIHMVKVKANVFNWHRSSNFNGYLFKGDFKLM